jgi:uncharacterized damage-inducible protein DinB
VKENTGMKQAEVLLAELRQECSSTEKLLACVPSEKLGWKPHPKSMDLRRLSYHVAEIPGWLSVTLKTDELDFATSGYQVPEIDSTETLLALFRNYRDEAFQDLEAASEDEFARPWTLRNGSHHIFTMPKAYTLRSFVMNHLIHHRGQLSVYLRLLDVSIPGMYGPSADEMEAMKAAASKG